MNSFQYLLLINITEKEGKEGFSSKRRRLSEKKERRTFARPGFFSLDFICNL